MPDAPRKGPASSPPLGTSAGNKKIPKNPAAGDEGTIKVASKKDSKPKANGIIKLKKQAPKHSNPGNWQDGSVIDTSESKKAKAAASSITAPSPGPVVNQLDDTSRDTFPTGYPLHDAPDLQQCKHCKKSILSSAAKAHISACLRLKKEKAQRKKEAREARERAKEIAAQEEARKNDDNGSRTGGVADSDSSDDEDDVSKPANAIGGKTTGKVAGKKTGDAGADKGGKKRKAEGDAAAGGGPKQKKKKEEPKPKLPKPKGPVDVERQCGVITPSGQPCARSLTCKTHSMGAKRAVPGRSLPYDMLLAAYQKKNQAKQQKAALDANAPLEEEEDPNSGPVDSDEETTAVMSALARWNPQPVVPQPVFMPIKREYQLKRLHQQLQTATNGGRLNIFKVSGFGAQKLPDGHPANNLTDTVSEDAPGEDAPGELDSAGGMMSALPSSRRSSSYSISIPPTLPHQPQRRPSVTGRA